MNRCSQQYVDPCRGSVAEHVGAYRTLDTKIRSIAAIGAQIDAAITAFKSHFFNDLVLALDSHFVHRGRAIEGKDGNPPSEVRMLCNSMMSNGGTMCADKTIKHDPEKSMLKYRIGDLIGLSAADFTRLYQAFLTEIERKYL